MTKLSLQHGGTVADPAKRVRNLKKRLAQIEELEGRLRGGAALDPEQRAKVESKISVLEEVKSLESIQ